MTAPTEMRDVYLRWETLDGPADLHIGNGAEQQIIRLRPSQLKQLAVDATRKALKIK